MAIWTAAGDLRDAVFGHGAYSRSGAPEFGLLAAAAPLFSADTAREGLHLVAASGYVGRRLAERLAQAEAAAALIERLPLEERDAALAQTLERMPELARYLSPALAARAARASVLIGDDDSRLFAQARLSPYLSRDLFGQVLETARAEPPGWRLLAVAPPLVQCLGAVPYLTGGSPVREELIRGALASVSGEQWSGETTEGMELLAPHLSSPLHPRAVYLAREAGSLEGLGTLAALSPYLSLPLRDEVLREIGSAVASPLAGEDVRPFLTAGARLPRAMLYEAAGGVRAVRSPEARAVGLAGLGAFLDEGGDGPFTREAMEAAAAIGGSDELTGALFAAMWGLPEGSQRKLLESPFLRVGPVHPPAGIRDEVARLSAGLPAPERDALGRELLAALWDRYGGASAPPEPPPGYLGLHGPGTGNGDEAESAPPEPAAAEDSTRSRRRARRRVVSNGFAPRDRPEEEWPPTRPLPPGERHYFWVELAGRRLRGSITHGDTPPIIDPGAGELLEVAVFTPRGGFRTVRRGDVGVLRLDARGAAVVRQPAGWPKGRVDAGTRRLFFALDAPARPGTYRFRCNLYHRHNLLQSFLVTARVDGEGAKARGRALRSKADFTLVQALDSRHLERLQPQTLSIMMNGAEGTHELWLMGEHGFKRGVTVSEGTVDDQIRQARGVLRRISWNSEDEWTGQDYLYAGPPAEEKLRADLVGLAIRGFRLFSTLVFRFAGGGGRLRDEFERLMRPSGRVQVTIREGATQMLPAALIYDHALDTGLQPEQYTLCPEYLRARGNPAPLADCRCFRGDCPSVGNEAVVCPSGFWGFRHSLSMPLSVGAAGTVPPDIEFDQAPRMLMGVSTDARFTLRDAHEAQLRKLQAPGDWVRREESREAVLDALDEVKPHLVYFYCHGGWDASGSVPYLQVGPVDARGITPDNLVNERIWWEDPRPLVFINGCHTTAVEPKKALEFVGAFVQNANAAGVVGTEITIFEPLARDFAEECLLQFVREHESIGQAVRLARLALLKAGNPLGLVYIPFVLGSLQMVAAGTPSTPTPD